MHLCKVLCEILNSIIYCQAFSLVLNQTEVILFLPVKDGKGIVSALSVPQCPSSATTYYRMFQEKPSNLQRNDRAMIRQIFSIKPSRMWSQ